MLPQVSVCLPAYNGANYLSECIESILSQSYGDFELLIVDDQSTDQTLTIVNDYTRQDRRIRVEMNDHNLGLVGNWNRCLELAQSHWIKFVFQDDLIAPTCLEQLLLVAEEGDVGVACCYRDFIFGEGVSQIDRDRYLGSAILIDEFASEHGFRVSSESYAKAVASMVISVPPLHVSNYLGEPTVTLLRRDLCYRFGAFNPHLIQVCDVEYWNRLGIHQGVVYVPQILASFRVHASAATYCNRDKRQFRTQHLDPLLLCHDLVLHPLYAPVREALDQWFPSVDPLAQLRQVAWEAWFQAQVSPHADWREAWHQATQIYPLLGALIDQAPVYKFPRRFVQMKLDRLRHRFPLFPTQEG